MGPLPFISLGLFVRIGRRLLKRRRHRNRWLLVLRANHATSEQPEQDKGRTYSETPAKTAHCFVSGVGVVYAEVLVIRTGVPLIKESDGLTITWSVGVRPEVTCTVAPGSAPKVRGSDCGGP